MTIRGGAIAPHKLRPAPELLFPFFQTDRIHHAFALKTFQPGLQHRPAGAVDHHRHTRDVGLRSHQVEKACHCRRRVEHRLIHVDVDQLRASLDLLPRDRQGIFIASPQDQLREFRRTADVRALADIDEIRLRTKGERSKPAQASLGRQGRERARPAAFDDLGKGADVIRVVPQQPPTMLSQPLAAYSPRIPAISSGVWS